MTTVGAMSPRTGTCGSPTTGLEGSGSTHRGERTTEGPAEGFLHAEGACAVAIDSEENFYTAQYGNEHSQEMEQSWRTYRRYRQRIWREQPRCRSIHRSPLLGYEASVEELDPEGVVIGYFGGPDPSHSYPGLNDARGVAVDETTTCLCDEQVPGRIDSFSTATPITIPDTVTQNVTNISATGATLHGNIDPDSSNGGTEIVSCEFKWGLGPNNLENTASCDQALPINANKEVTATLSGLTTGTTYFFQITAKNSANEIVSTGRTLHFQPAGPPLVTDASVSKVHSDGAPLSGTVDPQGGRTTYQIEYGTTEAYGSAVPAAEGCCPTAWANRPSATRSPGSRPGPCTTSASRRPTPIRHTHGTDHTFTTFPFTPILKDPARTPMSGSRSAPHCCRIAAPTSWSRPRTPVDTTSSPTWSPGRNRSADFPMPRTGCSTASTVARSRALEPDESWHRPLHRDAAVRKAGARPTPASRRTIPFAESPFASDLDEASADLSTLAFGGAGNLLTLLCRRLDRASRA